ncbi:MAG: xanthine phosphoribosyltransferase [Cetobacterium sp.]|uniref:xanthine phosphoribosyltransferase n=1 Tax=unclassified Cetobacterium TaxID=2630983 RepID=UPI00163C0070|nr:xanthine phosphoribosyltransferase [Cetobacterium sp. 2A]
MKLLKECIKENGHVTSNSILKVDSFINHQIDPNLMMEIGKEFKNRFKDKEINKIITIEASGIAIGLAVAYAFNVPLVFAKKKKPSTMGDMYNSEVFSFTKKESYNICISKEFLDSNDKVLVVDDFLAMGNAVIGLQDIITEANAELVGVGIVIEKGFQDGAKILRDRGITLESLAIIESLNDNTVTFKN